MKKQYNAVSKSGTYNVVVTDDNSSNNEISKATFEAMQVISIRMIAEGMTDESFLLKAKTDAGNKCKLFAKAKKNGTDIKIVFYPFVEWDNDNAILPTFTTYEECENRVLNTFSGDEPRYSFVQNFHLILEDFCIISDIDEETHICTKVTRPVEVNLCLMALPQIKCTQNTMNISTYC